MNTSYYTILAETRSYAKMADVGVEFVRVKEGTNFVPHAKMDRAGRRTIVLEQPEPHWDKRRLIQWRGMFYHELGHFDKDLADDYELLKEYNIDASSFYGSGLNCLTDYRQEKHNLGMYAGRDYYLGAAHRISFEDIVKTHEKELPSFDDANSDAGIHMALLAWDAHGRAEWQSPMIGMSNVLRSILHPNIDAKVQKLIDDGYTERMDSATSAQDLHDIWNHMLEHVWERDPDEEKQKAQSPEGDGEEGAGEEGESGGKASDGKGGDKREKSSKGGKSEDKGDGERQGGKISWKDLQINKHDTEHSASYEPLEIDYWGYQETSTFPVSSKTDVRNYEANTGNVETDVNARYNRRTQSANVHSGLANKIRKLLQVKTQTQNMYGQKKGKLANKNIHRAGMVGTGGYREKVFKQKIQRYDLDTGVTVLIDFSGSMGGEKMEHAIVSGMMLNEAISKIGVPLEVLGFTDHHSNGVMNILKTFDKPVSTEELRLRMCRAANDMSSNADGEAILWAVDRLQKRKNKRKVLIVLSDGQPASNRGVCYQFTKDVIDQVHKDGRVEIYGIGIMDSTVRELYPHWSVIRHEDELEGAVLKVVKNHILK